jgi:hypothetical protein
MKKEKNLNRFIKYYTDPKQPGSFSGLSSFYRNLKDNKVIFKRSDLEKWIKSEDTYTLHKPRYKKINRNKIIVSDIDEIWQADLIDLKLLSKENDNFNYILMIIDVFSKYSWAFPLKNKSGENILEAFKKIFESGRKPNKIHTDQGNEFFNKNLKVYLEKMNIELYFINSETKAAVVERFNRTIKERMWRYFTYKNTYRYIDILEKLIDSYNNSYHRSIKTKPVLVNKNNSEQIFYNLYGFFKNKDFDPGLVQIKFKIGDKVRIAKFKKLFEKGYTQNWTKEIFTIDQVILTKKYPCYIIKDYYDEIIEGVFYEKELQKVYKTDNYYKYDKILKTRYKNGKKEYFVSWEGYPSKFNSWVTDLVK